MMLWLSTIKRETDFFSKKQVLFFAEKEKFTVFFFWMDYKAVVPQAQMQRR